MWEKLAPWWIDELDSDPAYAEEISPLLIELLDPRSDELYLDLGCGDGRLIKEVLSTGARVIGCDLNQWLLRKASLSAPVVHAVLPDLSWVRGESFDGAYVGLVLEHLENEADFFEAAANAIRPEGVLAVVINHPIWTAPKSSPIAQAGETLWRPGVYFGRGFSDEPAGKAKVRFYHRTLAALLNSASDSGWDLRHLVESGISEKQVGRFPDYAGQEHIPRILGVRWTRR